MAASTFDALDATGMERRQAEATAEQLRFAAGADRHQLAVAGLLFGALKLF